MDYLKLFNRLSELAKENDLSVKIETERDGEYGFKVWVFSYKYMAGKHITIESLKDVENIDFKEIATVNKVKESVNELTRLGYSKDDIADKFTDAIYGAAPKQVAV